MFQFAFNCLCLNYQIVHMQLELIDLGLSLYYIDASSAPFCFLSNFLHKALYYKVSEIKNVLILMYCDGCSYSHTVLISV